MRQFSIRAAIARGAMSAGIAMGSVAGFALMTACTPLQVVTHSVSTAEARVPPGRYELDPHHWSITFDVGHLKYSRSTMRFDRAAAALDWNEGGLEKSATDVAIDAASVDTNVPMLDRLVKGADMFDAARYPQIRFASTRFERTGDARGKLTGNLTIRGVTRPVTLDVKFNGYAPDPLTKQDTLGFSAEVRFSRAQFGLSTWFPAVGDDVHVNIEAEFVRPVAPAQ